MTARLVPHRVSQIAIFAGAAVVIALGIHMAQSVVSLLIMSLFAALIGTPPVRWLVRHRIPFTVAVAVVMFGLIGLLAMVGGVVAGSLSAFSEVLPFYQKRIQEQIIELRPWLAEKNIILSDSFLAQYFNPGVIMGAAVDAVKGLITAMSNVVLILVLVLFMLLESSRFPSKFRAAFDTPRMDFSVFTRFVDTVEQYLLIKTFISALTGILIFLWLSLIGVDSPVLWGFLAFLLNYVPNIGSSVAAVPAVLLAYIQLGVESALFAMAGYMTVNFILDNVIETKIMGSRLGLSDLVVFSSLILWGSLLGPMGMVLCIPLTMTLKFGCGLRKDLKWIALLLGPEIVPGRVRKTAASE